MKKIITTIAITLVAATAVRADVLALWDNDAVVATDVSAPVTSTHADLTSSALMKSKPASAGWGNALVAIRGGEEWVTNLSLAIASGSYFSFTISPDAGKQVDYDNLYMNLTTGVNVPPGTLGLDLLSSETGFTFEDSLANVEAAGPAGFNSGITANMDLSGVTALQNVANDVEFRLYYYDVTGFTARIGIGQAFAANGDTDLRVDGTVIPEPATFTLLGLAAGGLLWFRRRCSI